MRISDWRSDVCSSDLCPLSRRLDSGRSRRIFRCGHGHVGAARTGSVVTLLHDRQSPKPAKHPCEQIVRASCRERACQYVKISVVAGSLKKKQTKNNSYDITFSYTINQYSKTKQ